MKEMMGVLLQASPSSEKQGSAAHPVAKLRVLDLFSGIGGFSLGLERTGGFETVAFCEIEPFQRRVLAKHWPNVPVYEDVRELSEARLAADGIAVDIITGGFPCQDISFAGKGAGLAGERSGLFYEIIRLAGELRPGFILLENVAALLSRGLGTVLGELATLGYDAEWHCIPASAVGAPHRRDRVWIIAYPAEGYGRPHSALLTGRNPLGAYDHAVPWEEAWPARLQAVSRMDDGLSDRLDKVGSDTLGNAVVPEIPELIGRAILAASLDVDCTFPMSAAKEGTPNPLPNLAE